MRDLSAEHNPSGDPSPARSGTSFIMYCRLCEAQQLIPESNIESRHRTCEGLVGYVRCAFGHLVIHQFADAYPTPKPPASVVALRAQLAAADPTSEIAAPTAWPVARS